MRRGGQRSEPYDRNKFLQANFRFLVSDAADLKAHQSDADLMLDWGDVLEASTASSLDLSIHQLQICVAHAILWRFRRAMAL